MNRANMLVPSVSLIIDLSLLGFVWQQVEISRLLKLILEREEAYDQLVKYFFVKDSNFTIPLGENVWWDVEAWHRNPDSISEIRNGTLRLFYNETTGDWYGNSGVFQGRHTDGRYTNQLLIGRSLEEADFGDYVIFPKSMLSDRFWPEVRFRILWMGFDCFPSALDSNARVNLGITLMCAITTNLSILKLKLYG